MKFLVQLSLTTFMLIVSLQTHAKVNLAKNCAQFSSVAETSFVLFSKQELIALGECVAQDMLRKRKYIKTLIKACNEVSEANGILGITALSKAEAIKIGQCVGAINFVNSKFHGARVSTRYNYSTRSYATYHCTRGMPAVALITKSNERYLNTAAIRDIICEHER